ncbi:MAG: DNA-directed RNA polymerase subunit beta [Acidobacteria bacterium]|nr:DNA-directed RNA polymerase subunit beta [Acidobacteriota bacterium]
MDMLPTEREDIGLQAVFKSVFPIADFRDTCSLEFKEYSIGSWECKCAKLKGVAHLKRTCRACNKKVSKADYEMHGQKCVHCGVEGQLILPTCDNCGDSVHLAIKNDVFECQEKGMTFAVPLKVTVLLVMREKTESGAKTIRDIKEQEVYFGDIPLMTDKGTFIINGTERVIVSQLHRSPGVFYESSDRKTSYAARVIPYRGTWVDFEIDLKSGLTVRLDKKKKFPATVFLRALGYKTDEELLKAFYKVDKVTVKNNEFIFPLSENLVGAKSRDDILHPSTKEILAHAEKKITHSALHALQKAGIKTVSVEVEELENVYSASPIIDRETGEEILPMNEMLGPGIYSRILERTIPEFEVFYPEKDDIGATVAEAIKKDTVNTSGKAQEEIYRKLRQGEHASEEAAGALIYDLFFNSKKYDFSRVGRLKFNIKLGIETPLGERVLKQHDYVEVVKYLLKLRKNIGDLDDIDHLGNRRVRSVGELLENHFRQGLARMERTIKEKMSVYQELSTAMPHDLINAKPAMAAIREFFGSSQMSQFMDQTNPLSEVTHKRRLSALGPGGLSRERAGFEVRDVHPSHYGRICPIETPEGPNIGLISSLSCYAHIDEYGFIQSPYRRVHGGRVLDHFRIITSGDSKWKVGDIVEKSELHAELASLKRRGKLSPTVEAFAFYLSAWEEDKYVIAQANIEVDETGLISATRVNARQAGNPRLVTREEVEYVDVSPKQLVSVAAALIPFLEHDDANRALMGSNMQRQAVPLLTAESPLVGTGMEGITARDSGAVVVARRGGVIDSVDSQRVIIRVEDEEGGSLRGEIGADLYPMIKFRRSNQNTCINQKPIVKHGDRVVRGQVIADGPCTDQGELALGRNILVAFMPWRGYNFEDAILVSEKLVKDDSFTSIHIEEFEIEARETKLGPEEITRDIPNQSETALKNLDEAGIIRIGASVKQGDVLVGKVTPKGDTQLSPEEKLLKAIFGEKAQDVRDASLTTPPGIEGIVADVKIFTRKGQEKDPRAQAIEADEIGRLQKNLDDEIRIINDEKLNRVLDILVGQTLVSDYLEEKTGRRILSKKTQLDRESLKALNLGELKKLRVVNKAEVDLKIADIESKAKKQIESLKENVKEKIETLKRGDELSPGVNKMVKVYVAMKRKLQVGDKMAGRHGNKGVIARILPEEDMPYLPDGSPVEIVLNPLGVPSRMNVGQILETHLGWAARALGLKIATAVFDGARESDIKEKLKLAGLPLSGKTRLFDGMTGMAFEQEVTVGYIYMLKLSHMVDDKIHARSIGPYSLITQQPLGGKAQFGGQRFGEMEVWALEAYGAAHILQELLTAKSDDVTGRAKIYEAIVKGDASFEPGLPESFNVLVRELQSLCLDVEFLKRESTESGS